MNFCVRIKYFKNLEIIKKKTLSLNILQKLFQTKIYYMI